MTYVAAAILTVLNAAGLLLVVLGLPGTWLMVAATLLVAWWHGDFGGGSGTAMFATPVLVTIVALAAAGEITEFLAGVAGTKTAGGTRRGAIGALVGTLIGGIVGTFLIPIPVIGSLVGACAGAAIGAWGLELSGGRTMKASVRSGVGAGVGRFAGTVAKLVVGVAIWLIVAVAAFWP